ncbi:MAG TPA: hypothetical protein VGC56_17435 [Allosphingosinicella sp.]
MAGEDQAGEDRAGEDAPGQDQAGEGEEKAETPSGDGFVARAGKHRDMQVARVGKRKLFDKKRRKVFLEWFAATGNCVFSAAKAGVSAKTVWKHRVKDARFREAFDVAMEQGSVRAQARLMEDKAKGPIVVDGDLDAVELVPPDPVRVLDLVARIEAKRGGAVARRQKGRTPQIASNAEVEKALAKRLAVFAKRQRAMGRERCQVRVPDIGEGSGSAENAPGAVPVTPPPSRAWSRSPSEDGEA